jgi:peptidoglycan/LPS O-acetylase OafA/YrhL
MVPIVFAGQYRLNDLATPLLVGFLIFGCMAYRSSLTGRPLVRALAAVGLVSYSLYVWQQPFLTPYENLIGQSVLDWSFAFVPIALLSYWFIEQPLIRVGRRISRSMSSSRLEPVAR